MRVLFDTNVLLMGLPSTSPLHGIIYHFMKQTFDLVVSSEIFWNTKSFCPKKQMRLLLQIFYLHSSKAPNVMRTEVYFRWDLISAAPDDNKFTDAYLAARADYPVTTDSHFKELRKANYPLINVVSPYDFRKLLTQLSQSRHQHHQTEYK